MRIYVLVCSAVVLAALAGLAWCLSPTAGYLWGGESPPPHAPPGDSPNEKLLRDARIGTAGPSLLAFFSKRTLTEADRQRVGELIRKLGNDSFEVREQASADLQALGQVALPLLNRAVTDADPEIARRASECLQLLQEGGERAASWPPPGC